MIIPTQQPLCNPPQELTELRQWVTWKLVTRTARDGRQRQTKVPFLFSGQPAKSTDPRGYWLHYWQALVAVSSSNIRRTSRSLDGVGFVFKEGGGLTGIDLDDCIDEHGRLASWALEIVQEVASYTEVSPSGRGLKIIARGTAPRNGKRGSFEAYSGGRYFTITGMVIPGYSELRDAQEAIDRVCERWLPAKPERAERQKPPQAPDGQRQGCSGDHIGRGGGRTLAQAIGEDAKLARLYAGDLTGYGSASEAHLAFLVKALWWCQGDVAAALGWFDQSRLAEHPKASREDYRRRTVQRALELLGGEFYDPKNFAEQKIREREAEKFSQQERLEARAWASIKAEEKENQTINYSVEGVMSVFSIYLHTGATIEKTDIGRSCEKILFGHFAKEKIRLTGAHRCGNCDGCRTDRVESLAEWLTVGEEEAEGPAALPADRQLHVATISRREIATRTKQIRRSGGEYTWLEIPADPSERIVIVASEPFATSTPVAAKTGLALLATLARATTAERTRRTASDDMGRWYGSSHAWKRPKKRKGYRKLGVPKEPPAAYVDPYKRAGAYRVTEFDNHSFFGVSAKVPDGWDDAKFMAENNIKTEAERAAERAAWLASQGENPPKIRTKAQRERQRDYFTQAPQKSQKEPENKGETSD